MSRLLRAAAPVALAATVLAAVSACGDAVAQQSREHSVVSGVQASLGSVLIRNATITINPDGTSGDLLLALFNDGTAADALTSVSSPRATSAILPGPAAVSTVTAPATGKPYGQASNVTSVAPSPSMTGTSGLQLAAQSEVFLNGGEQVITLTGITGGPRIGDSLPITFQFAAAGTTTLLVPITQDRGGEPAGRGTATPAASQAGLDATDTETAPETPTPSRSDSP